MVKPTKRSRLATSNHNLAEKESKVGQAAVESEEATKKQCFEALNSSQNLLITCRSHGVKRRRVL